MSQEQGLPKKALVLGGKNGLLGRSVAAALEAAGVDTVPVSGADVDYFDADALDDFLYKHEQENPSDLCIVNAVAYTQVDKAEDEPEEAARLLEAGFKPASLGDSILRWETAALLCMGLAHLDRSRA